MHDFPNEVELLELNRRNSMKIMGWTPPQRPQWVKEIMKTPGHTKVQLLLLTILATSSVTSTALLISSRANGTLGGSTSNSIESLEVADANGRVKVTGRHTTEVLRNLTKTGNFWGITFSKEKSSVSNQPQEK
jgi:hypothetical protein